MKHNFKITDVEKMKMSNSTLSKNYLINEQYSILFFIKKGSNAETYRVKGNDGKLYFLKLFDTTQLHRTAFDEENNLLEIEILKNIQQSNIVNYIDSGEVIIEQKRYTFLVLDFVAGETISEKLIRESYATYYDVKELIIQVLEGLDYLHNLPEPIIHNEITPQNIMLDLSQDIPKAKIIDFGYARGFHQSSKVYNREGLNLNYVSNECLTNNYSSQSDIFSVGVLLYLLIYGRTPWLTDVSAIQENRVKVEEDLLKQRNATVDFNNQNSKMIGIDQSISKIIKKAITPNIEERYQSVQEFIQALKGEIEVDDIDTIQKVSIGESKNSTFKKERVKGKGFDAIAGMNELKAQLQLDVIDALHQPEEYAKYGVTIPNGMLLYGPPGCGKTFFAKHFAEEVGFNFMLITPSKLKSRFVNATQENISKMFEEAEKNAPTIIFIDEINELLPNRDSDAHEMSKSAVNEMLAQMDRTGQKGIFIIGATNFPDKIDPAILRSGRLDKKFYLSPPDFEARKELFTMYLKDRPLDFGIDVEKLAMLTDNYISADIEFLVNEVSRQALKNKDRITMKALENVIQNNKPSVSIEELKKYELVKNKLEGKKIDENPLKNKRPKIGF
jgi:transitional endoplasmic reticulum ATPase